MARPKTRFAPFEEHLGLKLAVSNSEGNQTELPPDYIDLEKRVDALKAAHQKMLAVT